MKQKKTLLILLGVMIAVCAGYYGATAYTTAKAEAEAEAEALVAAESIINVTSIEEEIVAVSWNYTTDLSFELVDEEWVYTEDTSISIESTYLTTIISTYSNITAERELVGGDTLADYGLEDPAYTITLTDASGVETVCYIGNAADTNYYFAINDKENVYTVSDSVLTNISYEITDLVLDDVFVYLYSDEIQSVTITSPEEELSFTDDADAFEMMATGIAYLDLSTCVNANASDELELYGLDEEQRVVWTVEYIMTSDDTSESTDEEEGELESATLYIGAYDEELGVYYVQSEGSNMVYTMDIDTILMLYNEYVEVTE